MVVIIKDTEKNDLSKLDGQQTNHQIYLKILDIIFLSHKLSFSYEIFHIHV